MISFDAHEQESVAGAWELCTDRIEYYHNAGSMIPYHKNLTKRGYKALIFRYISPSFSLIIVGTWLTTNYFFEILNQLVNLLHCFMYVYDDGSWQW